MPANGSEAVPLTVKVDETVPSAGSVTSPEGAAVSKVKE
jgi:hypothetical protein